MKPQNTAKTGKRKPNSTSWKSGQSGNPGGRPKLTEAQQAAREARAAAQPEAVARLVAIIGNPESKDQDAIAAAKVILDGLEPIRLEMDANVSGDVKHEVTAPVVTVTPERLTRVMAVLLNSGAVVATDAAPAAESEKPE